LGRPRKHAPKGRYLSLAEREEIALLNTPRTGACATSPARSVATPGPFVARRDAGRELPGRRAALAPVGGEGRRVGDVECPGRGADHRRARPHRLGQRVLEPRRTRSVQTTSPREHLRRHAALALSSAINEAGLNVALDTRKLIGQAQGMLMERYGLDEPRAFEVLRRYSQTHHLKLRRVAVYLVSTRELPTRLPIPDAYGHAGDRNGKVSDTGEMPPPRQP
jgi:ANTAR domain